MDVCYICLNSEGYVIFKVFMAALVRTNYLFLDVTPCYLVEIRIFKSSVVRRLIDL